MIPSISASHRPSPSLSPEHTHLAAPLTSNLLSQYVEGLYGALNVHPVAAADNVTPYDQDVTLLISDYYSNDAHALVSSYYLTPESEGNEPIPDAIMVNGAFTRTLPVYAHYGQRLRLRFVCAAAFSMFTVSIDGLTLVIMEVDSTIVQPYDVRAPQRATAVAGLA